MKYRVYIITVALSLLLLQACGGGGGGGGGGGTTANVPRYTGLTSEARVEETNAEDLSTAAASGATQSVVADSTGGAIASRSAPNLEAKLVEISPRIAQWIAGSGALYSARDVSAQLCDAGGSANLDSNAAGTRGTITFTNCRISDGAGDVIQMTGTVDFSGTNDSFGNPDRLSMTMHLTVSFAGESATINMSLNCVDLSGSPSCTISSDFVGLDGRVYRVTDITVTTYGSGYYIDATVYDPDNGRFGMTTTAPLAFECSNGVPSTGTVEISGSDTTLGTLSFVNCSEYNATIGASSTTYYWP